MTRCEANNAQTCRRCVTNDLCKRLSPMGNFVNGLKFGGERFVGVKVARLGRNLFGVALRIFCA